MSLIISRDKFTHPLLKPILLELTGYFKQAGISFFVIGATARDIAMELYNEKSGRLTHDLDIVITVNDWEQWQKFEKDIVSLDNFTKDKSQKQRFLYKEKFQLDIVPFGDIMKQDSKIFWPPDEEIATSVLGFKAADDSAIPVQIDGEIEIKVATLSGIFILKIIAWKDRNQNNNKDADDMGFIQQNYLSIHEERAATLYYDEVYLPEPFRQTTASAILLAKDIKELLKSHTETQKTILETLNEEVNKKEESTLINQIFETHKSLFYEEVLLSIQKLVHGLN